MKNLQTRHGKSKLVLLNKKLQKSSDTRKVDNGAHDGKSRCRVAWLCGKNGEENE